MHIAHGAAEFHCNETTAVPGKLEQEFLFMAAVRNMPNITRYVMSIRPRHSILPCLEGLLGWQKHRSKTSRDANFSILSHDFNQLPWSDPGPTLKSSSDKELPPVELETQSELLSV
jgi:hypothetical protein